MGILDDAIRQHLELKRQHGAEDEDLERLEQEAFGPAARPGDPGFETGESAIEPVAEPQTSEEQLQEEAPSEELAVADEPPAAEAPPAEEPPSEEAPVAEEPPSGSFGIFDAESEFGSESEEIPSGLTPAEQARIEHSHLEDTADHPAPTQLGPEDEAEEPPAAAPPAAEAPAAEPEAIEQPVVAEPESGEEPVVAEPESGEEPVVAEPAAEQPAEAPESDIFGADDDDFGLSDADLSLDEEEGAKKPAAEGEEGEEGEDLLEETPDFLQESEGEDLWFEQGPPRDFDFDDD